MVAEHNAGMTRFGTTTIAAALLTLPCAAAGASVIVCVHHDDPDHTYTVAGDRGVYTWSDHGIKRSWALKCDKQRGDSTACHRWEQYGEKGRGVMIFRILPDGTLIQAGSWFILDAAILSVTPGFVCTTQGD